MSKLYRKPVEVKMSGEKLAAFMWRSKWLYVEEMARINQRGLWWETDPGDTYRVKTKA